jgi:hypothetical protein
MLHRDEPSELTVRGGGQGSREQAQSKMPVSLSRALGLGDQHHYLVLGFAISHFGVSPDEAV